MHVHDTSAALTQQPWYSRSAEQQTLEQHPAEWPDSGTVVQRRGAAVRFLCAVHVVLQCFAAVRCSCRATYAAVQKLTAVLRLHTT